MTKFRFRFKSIQTSIVVSFSALIIISLLTFMFISMDYTENAVIRNSQDYSMQLVDQVNTSLDHYIDNMGNVAYMMKENKDVITFLQAENTGEYLSHRNRLVEQFSTILDSRPDIVNIGVVGINGRYVFNRGKDELNDYLDYKELDWFDRVVSAQTPAEETHLSASHVQNIITGHYPWVVTHSQAIKDKTTGRTVGVFFVDLNYSSIVSLGKSISLGTRGYVFIVDRAGEIIYHPQQQLIYSGIKEEKIQEVIAQEKGSFVSSDGVNEKLYTFTKSDETGWTAVGVSYLDELMRNRTEVQKMYVLIAFGLFAGALILAIIISRAIAHPLRDLSNAMQEVEQGHFDYHIPEIRGENEIAELGSTFEKMTHEIQHLMDQNIQEQGQKRKSELNALQSQINPHFLYNTLDSIIWMAESGDNEEVVLMTSSLAKLLRQSISNADEIVTIEKELGYTRSYLTIQKMRYKDQLEYEIDLDPDTLSIPIVKLVVQPLVENAIYHGIKYAEHKGMILISSRMMDDCVEIVVEDNGKGMSPEVLEHLLEDRPIAGKSGKVGVYNVHNRLQLYYGPEYGLQYTSREGFGTRVSLRIPLPSKREEAENEAFLQ